MRAEEHQNQGAKNGGCMASFNGNLLVELAAAAHCELSMGLYVCSCGRIIENKSVSKLLAN